MLCGISQAAVGFELLRTTALDAEKEMTQWGRGKRIIIKVFFWVQFSLTKEKEREKRGEGIESPKKQTNQKNTCIELENFHHHRTRPQQPKSGSVSCFILKLLGTQGLLPHSSPNSQGHEMDRDPQMPRDATR
jgi:hypothetical protein